MHFLNFAMIDTNQNKLHSDDYHSKKVNPPPVRLGINYINAEDEDQMVFSIY